MAISRIEIKDLLVFKGDFSSDFCTNGVNVFIGENGTGKTTLMKVLYWGCEFSNKSVLESNGNLKLGINKAAPYNTIFMLYSYFNQLINENISEKEFPSDIKLYSEKTSDDCPVLDVSISNGLGSIKMHNIGIDFSQNKALMEWCKLKIQSVFIPVTEMLSHSRGFLALNRERPLPFDCTEMDIISKAELEPTREITPNALKVNASISKIIGGDVTFDGKDFYIERKNGSIPFSFEASGYRKFGLLWKLLRNGLLEKDSVLFWDEPENSLNKELVPELVEILLMLAKNGVQIFIATHDYHFTRYFDVRKDKSIPVMFHNLSKSQNGGIDCVSLSEYTKLPDNSMERASEKLYESVISDAFGVEDDE